MKTKKLHLLVMIAVFGFVSTLHLNSQQLAFPGAEGFGRYTTGGRGGSVYHVTNLNDSGTGSLRDAVSQSNRIVVFDVGGIINITDRIVIHSNVTVAGQTAPGGGIMIYGNGIALNGDSGNDIIRYIRIRMGKNGDSGKDAVSISEGQDYIFDHVSISWGRDGTLDVNGSGIDNLTFQDCIIAQGINNSNHSTGGLMQSGKWSMIRSLYIDNKTRNPKARGTHEFINSVLYNWAEHGYIMGDTEGTSECNLIGNYFIYGPSSNSNTHITGTTPTFYVYAEDNWVDSDKDGNLDGSRLTDYKTATVMSSKYNYPGVITQMSAQDALSYVIQHVGASLYRDAVDELLINQLTSYGTSGQIINTEDDNGISGNVGTLPGGSAPTDSDGDGMPDSWESSNGMNPNSADHNGDNDGDGYTNIEEYFDWIVNSGTTQPAELIKHGSGSSSQSVELGQSIQSFYYNWVNASSVNVTGLPSGVNASINTSAQTVTISGTPSSTGTFNYTITTTGGSPNATTGGTFSVTSPASSVTIEENNTGFCGVDGSVDNNNAGYTGDGFANTDNASGNGVDWKVNFTSSGTHTFTFRYASTSDRPGNLIVNGSVISSNISFPSTGSWTSWSTVSASGYVSAGTYDVRLEATGSSGLANIDNITITNAGAASCTATPVYYSLSTSVSGSGSVNPSSGTYESGQSVSLTATPSSGWSFSGWSGDASGSNNPVTVTMDGNKTVTANFTQNTVYYTLSTNVSGQGSVSPSSGTYQSGQTVTLTATPASGWELNSWSGVDASNGNTATVTMNGNKTITATFTETSTGGNITVRARGVQGGEQIQLIAGGSTIGTWTLTTSYTDYSASGSGNIQVYFINDNGGYDVQIDYVIIDGTTLQAEDQETNTGVWTGTCGGSYSEWLHCNGYIDFSGGSSPTQYTLSTNVNGQGSVSGAGTYNAGSQISVTASPSSGWSFSNWSGDASGSSNPVTITMDGNKTVTANFTQATNNITLRIEENSTGFCSVDGSVDNNNSGFSGDGFANTDNASGNGITWSVNIPSTGTYDLLWRYANGGSTDRTGQVMVDGSTVISNVSMPSTSSWTTWTNSSSVSVSLSSGDRLLRLQATNSSGLSNIDYIEITGNNPQAVSCSGLRSAFSHNDVQKEYDFNAYFDMINKNRLHINYYIENESPVIINIYNLQGRLILSKNLGIFEKGDFSEQVNLDNLISGIYLIKASINNEIKTEKVIR